MKKMLVLAISAVLVLGMILPVLAADNGNEAVVKAYTDRLEAQKAYLDALAQAGTITQEQVDLAKKNIDIRIEFINSDDFNPNTWNTPNAAWGNARRDGRFGGPMMGWSGGPRGRFGGPLMGGYGACPWVNAPAQ